MPDQAADEKFSLQLQFRPHYSKMQDLISFYIQHQKNYFQVPTIIYFHISNTQPGKLLCVVCICRDLRYSQLPEICVMSRLHHCLSEASLTSRLMPLADFCRLSISQRPKPYTISILSPRVPFYNIILIIPIVHKITKNSQNNIDKPNQECYLMNIRCQHS